MAKQLEKQGYTVVNNQLVDSDTTEVTCPSGDKLYTVIGGVEAIVTSDGTAIVVTGGTDKVVDLTRYFGGTSNIPADLLSNPSHWSWYDNGAGSYDAGTLMNGNGRYLVCTGRNIYKSGEPYTIVIPNRAYNYKGGSVTTITYYDKDKNSIGTESVSSGSQFTTPSNCIYIASSVTSGVTISLYYSPEQGGEGYDVNYPYVEPKVYDTGTEVLKSAKNARDIKESTGIVTRKIATVDLGTLNWTYWNSTYGFYTKGLNSTIRRTGSAINNSVSSKYGGAIKFNDVAAGDKCMALYDSDDLRFCIKDSAYSDAATFKTAMSGVYLNYELATPTTEQGTSFPENIEVDDYGMMYWLDTNNALVGIPQGVKLFYPADYALWLDTAVSATNGDATDIALKGELASGDPETIKGVVDYINAKIPAPPAEDGTYTLTVAVADGTATYSWESTT